MRKKRRSQDNSFNVWRSYSDLMAGILLLFVLIMCVTLFQAQKSYNESIEERDEKIKLQEEYTMEILAQQTELDEKEGQLQTQDEQLEEQKMLLAEYNAKLKEQEEQLNAQAAALADQQVTLDEKTAQLADQQAQIDQIIGVKAEVISSLKQEFANNNVSVDIDTQTGALTLDASILFDYDNSELTQEGKDALSEILPIYCKVLLEEDTMPYLAEIIIDGYTDTDGDYSYNLMLSQMRSLAVAQYLLDIQYDFLDDTQVENLENYLTVNGHSMANPILDADGNIDKDASRRVEVKFRLKDDEMIDQLSEIMASSETGDTKTEDTETEDTKTQDTTDKQDQTENGTQDQTADKEQETAD
jgi:chemotaxis protein MotB